MAVGGGMGMIVPMRRDPIPALAAEASSLRAFREGVLSVIRKRVPFDAAIYHALSPAVPLETGVLVGIRPEFVAATVARWDEFGSLFGALRERAHRDGVATDRVLPRRARQAFRELIGRPLRLRSWCMCHLVVRGRFVAALALFSRQAAAFSDDQVSRLMRLLPAVSAGDALHQLLDGVPMATASTRLACTDQRLTPRQREVVEYVALGHTNAAIAGALGLSPHAIRNHLARVFERLGAANRAEVVRLAVLVPATSAVRAARR